MLGPYWTLARPAHWIKNVFVLAPLVFGARLLDPEALVDALLAFACFCAAASSIYAFNDLTDREADRSHPLKKRRPVAAGEVSPAAAGVFAALLAVIAAAGGWSLGPVTFLILAGYIVLNLLYTRWLKHIVILDVMIVAVGFLLRVAGGAAATDIEVSAWLLLCTLFLALFLAFSKRRHELFLLEEKAASQRRVLEHYSAKFLDQMINVVTASTVVTYALYTVSDSILERFGYRFLIATTPLVLFGIFRYLYLIYQRPGQLNPTEAVVKDLPSIANVGLWSAVVCALLYLT